MMIQILLMINLKNSGKTRELLTRKKKKTFNVKYVLYSETLNKYKIDKILYIILISFSVVMSSYNLSEHYNKSIVLDTPMQKNYRNTLFQHLLSLHVHNNTHFLSFCYKFNTQIYYHLLIIM
jgi:hypothetical protein